jgi:hypothetical protein
VPEKTEEPVTPEERNTLIEQYAAGYQEVADSLAGASPGSLAARPEPGKWSAAEIVHHLADSETTSALRVRMLVAHEHPLIHGYDQEAYARRLRYAERPIGPALEAFRAARESTVPLLRLMTGEDWTRPGWHTEMGPYDAETWLRIYARHAHDHARQIRAALAAAASAR